MAQRLLEEIRKQDEARVSIRSKYSEHNLPESVITKRVDGALRRSAVFLVLSAAGDEPAHPPSGACFLLDVFLAKADRKALLGDLEEEFATYILPKYGRARARFWFWAQTVRTIATRNQVCRWLFVGGLVRIGEWIFRKIGH